MPKEITFAILIGFILGLLITFGLYTANKAIQKQSQEVKTENTVVPTPSPQANSVQNSLTISEPQNEQLFTGSETTISGKTSPQAAVAILTETEDFFAEVDEDGFFSETIELVGGVNTITIISTDTFGNQAKTNLILTYSTKVKDTDQTEEETDE